MTRVFLLAVGFAAVLAVNGSPAATQQPEADVARTSRTRSHRPDDDRDAWNYAVGLSHVFRFAEDRHLLRLGYQLDVEDASRKNFSYLGHRLLTGVQYTLPWRRFETRLRYDYDVHFRNYTRVNTSQPTLAPGTRERSDTEQTHVIRVEQSLGRGLTLAADYQIIDGSSNLPLFSFDRNVGSLTLSWRY